MTSSAAAPSPADLQIALDEMRDGVALWSTDGILMVCNHATADVMRAPRELIRPGVTRLEMMTFFARRGDYGPSEDPDGLARQLSERFGAGQIGTLTRTLPDGRQVRADARLLDDGRSLVTYREVDGA